MATDFSPIPRDYIAQLLINYALEHVKGLSYIRKDSVVIVKVKLKLDGRTSVIIRIRRKFVNEEEARIFIQFLDALKAQYRI